MLRGREAYNANVVRCRTCTLTHSFCRRLFRRWPCCENADVALVAPRILCHLALARTVFASSSGVFNFSVPLVRLRSPVLLARLLSPLMIDRVRSEDIARFTDGSRTFIDAVRFSAFIFVLASWAHPTAASALAVTTCTLAADYYTGKSREHRTIVRNRFPCDRHYVTLTVSFTSALTKKQQAPPQHVLVTAAEGCSVLLFSFAFSDKTGFGTKGQKRTARGGK